MEKAAKEKGVKAKFQGPSEASVEQQLKIIESLITQGYDGIGISPNDSKAVEEIIGRAMDKGIAVVTFDSDASGSRRLVYIGTNNREAGRIGGRLMIDLLGAKPKAQAGGESLLVQIIGGQPGAENLNERMDGFKEAVEGTSITLADDLYNEENPDKAVQVAENAINAHPELKGFFCSNAFGGPGVALAVDDAIKRGRLQPNQIRVVAFDTTPDILNYIEEGLIDCTLAQRTHQMGKLSIEHLLEFAQQHQELGKFDPPAKGNQIIDTGIAVVRPRDVPKYRPKPEEGG
jgi:ribose transport system substrate-binding protein